MRPVPMHLCWFLSSASGRAGHAVVKRIASPVTLVDEPMMEPAVSRPTRSRSNTEPSSRSTPSHWVRAARSAIHGQGVYARVFIPDGTRIIEYTGERIPKAEAKRREAQRLNRQARGGDDCVYIFNLNRRHDLDGRRRNNLARLINHACAPNCRAEAIRGRIWIVARRDMSAGEELTFDYGFSFTEWPLHPCRCGGKRCPGFIVGSAQRWRLRRIPRAERARRAMLTQHREATAPVP